MRLIDILNAHKVTDPTTGISGIRFDGGLDSTKTQRIEYGYDPNGTVDKLTITQITTRKGFSATGFTTQGSDSSTKISEMSFKDGSIDLKVE